MTPESSSQSRKEASHPPRTHRIVHLILAISLIGVLADLAYAVIPALIGLAALQLGAAALVATEHGGGHPARLDRPISDLRRAAALLPANPLPLRYLARVYAQRGQYDEAVAALEQAVALAPDSLLVRKELMLAYQSDDRLEQAARLEAQLGYTPDQIAAIGDTQRRYGDHVEALRWYDLALVRDPSLAPQLAFRRLFSAGPTDNPRSWTLLREARAVLPELELPHVTAAGVTAPGALLRWVEVYSAPWHNLRDTVELSGRRRQWHAVG